LLLFGVFTRLFKTCFFCAKDKKVDSRATIRKKDLSILRNNLVKDKFFLIKGKKKPASKEAGFLEDNKRIYGL
jgi:hypothetical protein